MTDTQQLEPRIIVATVREGEDWDIECRFDDGQKFAAVTVDIEHEALAHKICNFLNSSTPTFTQEDVIQRELNMIQWHLDEQKKQIDAGDYITGKFSLSTVNSHRRAIEHSVKVARAALSAVGREDDRA